ncbi:unnamed protein product [Brassica napus]|uniref:(rape) hypothetical protein n=1 Tax=Brassica napus TaxID=3708 RepID=A0A816M7B7_BRANA|nr:unnamed protein product [Brassica napus]
MCFGWFSSIFCFERSQACLLCIVCIRCCCSLCWGIWNSIFHHLP